MAPSTVLTWTLSVLIGAAAVVLGLYTLQRPLVSLSVPEIDQDIETYCYRGVRTHDDAKPSARCFGVSEGVFTEVSEDSGAAEVRDGHVIPGLWDGHGHLMQYGEFLHSVDLFGCTSFEEVRERLVKYLDEHPGAGTKEEWVRGVGWDQMALGRMPMADDLSDERFQNLYIMLDRVDVHCTWISHPVLALLPSDIEDIPGGEIIREPGMGVFCDNAMEVVYRLFPKPSPAKKREFIKAAMKTLNSVGLVGVHDASVFPDTIKLWQEWAGHDDWTLRVYSMAECDVRNTVCRERVSWIDGDWLAVRSIKLFADGALGSWGSAMIDPYTDRPTQSGSLLVNATTLTQVTQSWSEAGFQVNIHAIGDLANRNAIDAMEVSLRSLCPDQDDLSICQAQHRFRIEHAQIIHPDDQERIRKMRLIPSIQPTHATSDMKYAEDRLGPERTAGEAYRMKSFLNQGLDIVLGSDFPVEPPDPFQGIYAAVTRKSPATGRGKDGSEEGWHTAEALSLEEAMRGFTTGPAYGGFMEGRAGLIREGAWADWVVLDGPVEEMDLEELRSAKVRETWVGGRMVYRRG